MLHDVYLDAIKNRESKTSGISDSDSANKKILERAKEYWVEYEPIASKSVLAGVDSSYNKQQFQGFHLYVIDAVCVTKDGNILAKDFVQKIGVLDQSQLEARSMEIETDVAAKAANIVDLILIDGSLIARLVLGIGSAIKSAIDLTREHNNIVFISKTSDSREIFEEMGSRVGDIYYFNHIDKKAGYSRPHALTRNRKQLVTVVFARLNDYTPLIKLELPGRVPDDKVREVLDKLAYGSVSGYPYVLKLAHNKALVSHNEIERLASIYGLKNEIGAREVLR
ncbi:MAG: DNA double-strand break repair nuclease NurA [Nitrososphaerales archaeon]